MLRSSLDPVGSVSRLAKAAVLAAAVCGGFAGETAYGDATGAQVVVGDVTFIHDGYRTIIQAADGSIINYISFDILPWETVQFVQPNQWSRVLNRITGPDPTVIAGQLLSNGQVYIINPAGVYFSQGSVVDVGSLYAAAGNMSNEDFTNHIDRFTGLSGEVVNHGVIDGTNVHLMGERVANHGSITSGGGIITMLAGDNVYMSRIGERINVRVDGHELFGQSTPYGGGLAPDMAATPGVENTGYVGNAGGAVLFGAGDLYSLAIRNTGVVEAAGGNVTLAATSGLIQNDGLLSASVDSGQAGSVIVQGPSVLNRGEIRADADSGEAGYVELTSQNHTFLTSGSVVSAAGGNANANAGEVLVHSYDGQTIFSPGATLDISGGLGGGVGGYAEVSGRNIAYMGSAFLDAVGGYEKGTLLIDPDQIIIKTGGGDPIPGSGMINFGDLPLIMCIDPTAIEMLAAGQLILQANDLIQINNGFTNNGLDLRLETIGGEIRFNAAISVNSLFANSNAMGGAGGLIRFGANAAVTSAAGQRYMSNVLIGIPGVPAVTTLTLTDTGAMSAVRFDGTVNTQGTPATLNALVINGNAEFFGDVGTAALSGIRQLTVNGTTRIGVGGAIEIRTAEGQSYNGLTRLAGNVTLTSGVGGIGTGLIWLNGAVTGIGIAPSLAVNTSGITRFSGPVGTNTAAFASITTSAAGSTEIGADMWAGTMTFNDDVRLTANSTLDAGAAGSVFFGKTVAGLGAPGLHDLTVNALTTTFSDTVTGLDALVTDPTGATNVNGDVNVVSVNFQDGVTLGGAGALRTITGSASAMFAAIDAGNKSLTVNAPMTAFNGAVTNVNTLMTDGGVGHVTTIAADITGQTLDFNDAVSLLANSTLTGTTMVDFASTIAGNANDLTVNSPVTAFNGDVTGVGTLFTDGGLGLDVTTIAANISGVNLDFNDAVALGANATLTGTTSVDFARTIAGNGNDLVVNSPTTAFNGAVTNIGTLTTDDQGAGDTTTIAADITGQTLDFNDAVVLGGAGGTRMLAGTTSVTFGSTIAGGGNGLTVTSPLINLDGNVNGVNALVLDGTGGQVRLTNAMVNATSATFSGTTFLRDSGVTTTGTQVYNGNTFLDTVMGNVVTTLMAGGGVTFNGIADAQGVGANPSALRIVGNATFNNDVGTVFMQLPSLEVTGSTVFNGPAALVRTTGFQTYGGPVMVNSPGINGLRMLSMGGVIRFDGALGGTRLTVDTAGDTIFNGQVAGITELNAVGGGNSIINTNSMTGGVLNLADAVVLNVTALMNGNISVSFGSTITGNGNSLTVDSPTTLFNGVASGLDILRTDANGTTTLNNASLEAQQVFLGDAVRVIGNATVRGLRLVNFGSSIDGAGANLVVRSNERINFRGDVGATNALASLDAEACRNNTANEIVFFGNRTVNTVGAGGIRLNAAGRGTPTQVASIGSTGSLTLNAMGGGNVIVGQNEKLTAVGDLTINGALARFGDLNSGGNINVNANSIEIWRRAASPLLTSTGGAFTDIGADLVALGSLNFSIAPTFIGTGGTPLAAAGGGITNPGGLILRPISAVFDRTLVDGTGRILDLGVVPGGDSLAEAFEETDGILVDRTLKDPILMRALEQLSIFLRPLTAAELLSEVGGAAIYIETPVTGLQAARQLQTASNRLDRRFVVRVLEQYASMFLEESIDPETGEVVFEERSDVIRETMTAAWEEYQDSAESDDFRTWLEDSGDHPEALAYLNDLRALFRDVEVMGTTKREQQVCMQGVCNGIAPSSMDPGQFIDAIGSGSSG